MRVVLKKNKDKFILRGYPWVFANLVDRIEGGPSSGDVVEIADNGGKVHGLGLFHATSKIAVRFLTADAGATIDPAFFRGRLERSFRLRRTMFGMSTHCRMVFGESDGIPGTIIDRYGDVVTWTTLSFGIDQRREWFLDAIEDLLDPIAIVERNDVQMREKDGLPLARGVLRGSVSETVPIRENTVTYQVDVINGSKTGFFIDQRLNRAIIRRFSSNRRVLDAFCADGGFGLQAADAGAAAVHMLDVSDAALQRARNNAAANGMTDRVTFQRADALEHLGALADQGEIFDMVILDPPAFAKSKRHREEALRAYQRININALQLLEPGGILATSSCSQVFSHDDFMQIIRYAARKTGKRLRLLFRGSNPPDHPVLLAMPETSYLKFLVLQVTGDEQPH